MKKKIVVLVPALVMGGAERQVSLIMPLLSEKGFDVSIISMIKPVEFLSIFEKAQIPVYSLGMEKSTYNPGSSFKLLSLIRKLRPEIVITFNFPGNITGRFLKLFYPRFKLVTSIRSPRFGSDKRQLLMKLTRKFDNLTVTNSKKVEDAFLSLGVIDKKRSKVINNGIEIFNETEINEAKSEAIKIREFFTDGKNDCFLWIAVGRIEMPKDYENLVTACRILKSENLNKWKLLIIGGGSLSDRISKLIIDEGLEDIVILAGHKSFVSPYYYAADAFVMSSAWEGMPNSLAEAMIAKLPVVATNVGEVPNLLFDDSVGLMVPAKDSVRLADAMRTFMQMEPAGRRQIGINANEFVHSKFALNKIVSVWNDTLDNL